MAGKSDYLELKILDGVLGGPDFVRPATSHVALYTVAPSDAGGGTEVSGGSYARAAVTNSATNWPAAAAGADLATVELEKGEPGRLASSVGHAPTSGSG